MGARPSHPRTACPCGTATCGLACWLADRRPPVRGKGQPTFATRRNRNLFLPVGGHRAIEERVHHAHIAIDAPASAGKSTTRTSAQAGEALAHRELTPVLALLDRGLAMTAPIAAALGGTQALALLLADASPEDRTARRCIT